jgi:hypothetical protein
MAAIATRGGGERGSIERGKSRGFTKSMADLNAAGAKTVIEAGSTKTTDALMGRSGFWQQDMLHEVMLGIS